MNKKLLICGVIVAGLVLTACSKKEHASDTQDQQAAPSEQSNQNVASEQFHSLTPTEQSAPVAAPAPAHKVEVEHQETNNTTTEIRREVHDAPASTDHDNTDTHDTPAPAAKEKVKNTAPTSEKDTSPKADTASKTKAANTDAPTHQKSSSAKLSEDDAVAAAIAAATPALKN